MLPQTYCSTRVALRQANHFLVGRRGLSPGETSVRGLPQGVRVGRLVVDVAAVAHVARDVANASDAPLVVTDHVRQPMVVMVMHVVGLTALHLPVAQSVDQEEEQRQGECGDHATGH